VDNRIRATHFYGVVPGFNSATTLRSWITVDQRVKAAMDELLQFGHDAEVVDNKIAGIISHFRGETLQFGHDAEVVDNRGGAVGLPRVPGTASIRPRR